MRKKAMLFFGLILIAFIPRILSAQKADALALYRQGQFRRAVEICQTELNEFAINQTRQRMDSYTVLGWSYIALGEYEQALDSSRKALGEVSNDARLVEIQAEALYYIGRNTEALRRFEEYVSLNSTGDRIGLAYYFMGEIFVRLAEYRHADIALSTALYFNPQTAGWWVRLGYAREQIPNKKGAEAAYTEALNLQPSLNEAQQGLERVRG